MGEEVAFAEGESPLTGLIRLIEVEEAAMLPLKVGLEGIIALHPTLLRSTKEIIRERDREIRTGLIRTREAEEENVGSGDIVLTTVFATEREPQTMSEIFLDGDGGPSSSKIFLCPHGTGHRQEKQCNDYNGVSYRFHRQN